MTVWILTCEYNEYDQYGEYFEAVFATKPRHQQLTAQGVAQTSLRHVLNGGGRKGHESNWFYLREVEPK